MLENLDVKLLNLDHRTDRLEAFKQECDKSKIISKYQRVSAINGKLLDHKTIKQYTTIAGYEDILNNQKTNGLRLSYGGIGVALSYKKILSDCKNNTLILEDDILINENFDTIFTNTFYSLPSDWDILYLGWYNSKNLKTIQINQHVNRLSGQINGLQAWMINPESAKKICSIFPIRYQIDTEIYLQTKLNKYSTPCKIVTRSKHSWSSDIQIC